MKFSFINMVFTLGAVFTLHGTAAEESKRSPLIGLWVSTFTTTDGGQVSPRVRFRMKDGELTGTSTFRSNLDAPLKNIVFKDGQVSFDVVRDYLGDKVTNRYRGTLSGTTITGKIASTANGETQTYNWEARRISGVEGVWKWTVTFNERSFDQRVTLKPEGEKLSGKLATGRGDIDIHRGRFKDNRVHFETERRGGNGEKTTNVYRGTLDGDKINGTYISNFGGRRTNEWNAVRD